MASDLLQFDISTRVGEIMDITEECQQAAKKSTVKDGIVNIFMPGSTGGITTIEYEPGLVKSDIPKLLQHLIPEGPDYFHHRTWGDHNGAGHLRSFMIKPSLTVPVSRGSLILGTWQQVIYCEFDERPRHRTIYCQFVG